MNHKQLYIPVVLFLSAACLFTSCKSKKTDNPCGDPPPPSEVPAVRFIDKPSGKDYFFQNPEMFKNFTASLPCNTGKQIDITYQNLLNSGHSYGYGLHFSSSSGLYIATNGVPSDCYKMILKWNGTDEDTIQFYYRPVTNVCFTRYELDSVYFNGVKSLPVKDTSSLPAQTYYNLLK